MANWKVNVYKMVLDKTKNMKSYSKQHLDSFEINELNPKYNEIDAIVQTKYLDAQWEIQAISTQAENTSLFEM
jgi:hypothetical protein